MAAADYATGDGPLPEPLEDYFAIESWGSPDGRTGWMDWPHGWRLQMQAARNVYNAFEAYGRQPAEKQGVWLGDNPKMAKIISLVWKLSGVFDDDESEVSNPTAALLDELPADLPPEARAAIEARQRQNDG